MPLAWTFPLALRAGPLEFGDPRWLFGLLVLIPIYYWWRTSRVPASPLRRWVSLIVRMALVVGLIFSLADTRMTWSNKGICVAFVIDQSQSVSADARAKVRELIKTQIEKMTKDDQFVIVEFGGDSVIEALPSPRGPMPQVAAVEDTAHTNLARALRLAMASFPSDHQKRIVLFSDGNQNQEDALREARIAGVKDVDVDVVPILALRGNEAMVDQVIIPPHVRKGARFVVRALVSSTVAQNVDVVVYRDGSRLLRLENQPLKAGSNVVDIPDSLGDGAGGTHQYQVTIVPRDPQSDTLADNNSGYGLTQMDAPGKVLLVPGRSGDPTLLYDALRAAGVPVVKTAPGGLPSNVQELAAFDCVIMDNVNYHDVSGSPQTEALKHWVEDYGGGLVLVGGDDSFGPGGYKGTVLEELAPVAMDVKREKHMASLAVAVVLDKSGSMGAPADNTSGMEKMQLANEGGVEVVKLLDAQDLAMLGACDTAVRWVDNYNKVIPMTPGNKQILINGIRSVRAGGGGIDCFTALKYSYDLVVPAKTMAKHVIMFGDSTDCDFQEGCVQLARDMYERQGITTSVIGMGVPTDPHVPFQKEVADAGHGQFFIANDVKNLPKLFLKDAFLVSRQAYIEDANGITLTPYASPLLQGFITQGRAQLPLLYGYVGTTLKPRATLALHGKQPDDPVLAHWTIGLGKCVAFMSDASSRWGKDWAAWDGYSKFWSQVVRWVSRSTQGNGLTTTTVIQGSQGHIIVDAVDANGKPINNLQLRAGIVGPNQSRPADNQALQQIGPGRYASSFPADQRGTYLVAVSQAQDNGQQLVSTSGAVMPYAEEYRDLQANVQLLKSLADASNGRYLTDLSDIFGQKPEPVRTFWPLWQVLLILACVGLLLDIAWRRLNVADWFRSRKPALAVERTGASVGALRTVKTGRRDVDSQRVSMRQRVESLAATQPAAPDQTPPDPTAPQADLSAPSATAVRETPAAGEGYANRLLTAKRRAKDQIREQEQEGK